MNRRQRHRFWNRTVQRLVLFVLGWTVGVGFELHGEGQELLVRWTFNAGEDGNVKTGTLWPEQGMGTIQPIGGVKTAFYAGSPEDSSEDNSGLGLRNFPPSGKDPRTAGLEIRVPTTGYEGILLRWDWRVSRTAARHLTVLYTTDGENWKEAGRLEATKAESYMTGFKVSFEADPAVSDNPQFAIRLVSDFSKDDYAAAGEGATYSPNGTWRFDRIEIFGIPIAGQLRPPTLLSQPQDQTVWVGDSVSFSVRVDGTPPFAFQWFHNGVPISGATNWLLRLDSVQLTDAGRYEVVVSNPAGQTRSRTAMLTVQLPESPPQIFFTNFLSNLLRPGDAPVNTFTEHGLVPGERFHAEVFVVDPTGRPLQLSFTTEPEDAGIQWDGPMKAKTNQIYGQFQWTPRSEDEGRFFTVILQAANGVATNTVQWRFYVLTSQEQRIAITEFLANPTGDPQSPLFNPLHRETVPDSDLATWDEYVEIANLSSEPIDLQGWTFSDGVQVRHRFEAPTLLTVSNVLVLYGGPTEGFPPQLDKEVLAVPANASSDGLALNNKGDVLILRNAQGGIVERVVYNSLPEGSALTRYPTIEGPFVPQRTVADQPATPGRQWDGKRWNEPATIPVSEVITGLHASLDPTKGLLLEWEAKPGRVYRVERAADPRGPYHVVASGLTEGRFVDPEWRDHRMAFYRIRFP